MKTALLSLLIGLLVATFSYAQEAQTARQIRALMAKEDVIIAYWKKALVMTRGVSQRRKISSNINHHIISRSDLYKKLDEIKEAEIELSYERQYRRDLANQPQ